MNICPKQAISMQEDEYGFIYPFIDEKKCVGCSKCARACAFQNKTEDNFPVECYAAVSKNEIQRKQSASAGIFAAMATDVIAHGGIVYGAAFADDWSVHHVRITETKDIIKIQGSKYVQSYTDNTFSETESFLKKGKTVLYSGTPCQIAGLKEFLGKDYENLITVDIICHGVPSCKMLKDYLKLLCDKHKGSIEAFTFRDKSIGWGINGSAVINSRKVKLWQSASSYLYYFTKGWIYRENCYKCKYASKHRSADITLGDYWGIESQHPELFKRNGWDEDKGISCVIINTAKGSSEFDKYRHSLNMVETSFDRIAMKNAQLNRPCSAGDREKILSVYADGGWGMVDKTFNKDNMLYKPMSFVKHLIPKKIRRYIKMR